MEGKKLRIDSRGEIILLRRRRPEGSKSGYRALNVKIGVLAMWCCIFFISPIAFFPPVVVSERVLRYLCSGGREEAEDAMIRGTISLTEWPSLRHLKEGCAGFSSEFFTDCYGRCYYFNDLEYIDNYADGAFESLSSRASSPRPRWEYYPK
jgi:hypothetical protein